MIPTPYSFEANFSPEEFQKLGQFASRWAYIELIIGNCLQRVLDLTHEHATIMVFPLSLDMRMQRLGAAVALHPLLPFPMALYGELRPLIRAMQFLRTTALHGVVVGEGGNDARAFHLRSKNLTVLKNQLFGCEDNYTAHVALALRLELGDKDGSWPQHYELPSRPQIPAFLPDDCRSFSKPPAA